MFEIGSREGAASSKDIHKEFVVVSGNIKIPGFGDCYLHLVLAKKIS
jgi:hypothetical protein